MSAQISTVWMLKPHKSQNSVVDAIEEESNDVEIAIIGLEVATLV
jgi:hypothetical protein